MAPDVLRSQENCTHTSIISTSMKAAAAVKRNTMVSGTMKSCEQPSTKSWSSCSGTLARNYPQKLLLLWLICLWASWETVGSCLLAAHVYHAVLFLLSDICE